MQSKKVLLIGDSITERFNAQKYLTDHYIVNKGVSGDTSSDTLNRLNSGWFEFKPDFIFICIGTNDIANSFSDDKIVENIKQIARKSGQFGGKALIVLTSIFPTKFNRPRPNQRIYKLNKKIETLAEENGYRFFNLNPHFADENGSLYREYTYDGLHLSEKAYELWGEKLREFLKS